MSDSMETSDRTRAIDKIAAAREVAALVEYLKVLHQNSDYYDTDVISKVNRAIQIRMRL